MKCKQKIMSVLLCLCMMFTLLPTVALATDVVTTAAVTVPEPKIGEKPATTMNISLKDRTQVYILGIYWTKGDGTEKMTESTFQGGETYTANVSLYVQRGMDLKFDNSDPSKLSFTINKKPAKLTYVDGREGTISYQFPTLGDGGYVTKVSASIDAPTVGKPLDETATVAETNFCSVTNVEWEGWVDSDHNCKKNQAYRVKLTVTIPDAINWTFSRGAGSDFTVNGAKPDATSWISDKQIALTYSWPALGASTTTDEELNTAYKAINAVFKDYTPTNDDTLELLLGMAKSALPKNSRVEVSIPETQFAKQNATTEANGTLKAAICMTCDFKDGFPVQFNKLIPRQLTENQQKLEADRAAANKALNAVGYTNEATRGQFQAAALGALQNGSTADISNMTFRKTDATFENKGQISGSIEMSRGEDTTTVFFGGTIPSWSGICPPVFR